MSVMSVKFVYGFVRILGLVAVTFYSRPRFILGSHPSTCFKYKKNHHFVSLEIINAAFARGVNQT